MKIKHYEPILKWIFILGLLLMPFIYWPRAPVPFEVPRVWFINRWIELLILSGLIFSSRILKKERIGIYLTTFVILFIIVIFISSLLGLNLAKSIVGNYYRSDGLMTITHLIALFFFVVLFFNKDWLKHTFMAMSLGSVFIAFWTIVSNLQLLIFNTTSIPSWNGAIGVSFGNPNFLAGYLLTSLPFVVLLYEKENLSTKKRLLLFVILIQIIAILLTKAWAAILGVLLFAIGWSIIRMEKINIFHFALILLGIILAVGVYTKQRQMISNPTVVVAEGRERIIRKGLLAFQKRPILGWGWANFDYAFESVDWPVEYKDDVYVDKAHSSLLEILVTTGIVGLSIYILMVVCTATSLVKRKALEYKYLLFSFILLIIHMQTNIVSIAEEVVFWIIAGLAAKSKSS